MTDTTKMTAAAYEALKAEIHQLETEGRREKAEKISIARDFGDLKENSEYHTAKDDAALLEAKISRLTEQLRSAEIVEAVEPGRGGDGLDRDLRRRGQRPRGRPQARAGDRGQARDGLLSIDSPVGRALAGAQPGDTRSLQTPKGTRTMRVLGVEHS